MFFYKMHFFICVWDLPWPSLFMEKDFFCLGQFQLESLYSLTCKIQIYTCVTVSSLLNLIFLCGLASFTPMLVADSGQSCISLSLFPYHEFCREIRFHFLHSHASSETPSFSLSCYFSFFFSVLLFLHRSDIIPGLNCISLFHYSLVRLLLHSA